MHFFHLFFRDRARRPRSRRGGTCVHSRGVAAAHGGGGKLRNDQTYHCSTPKELRGLLHLLYCQSRILLRQIYRVFSRTIVVVLQQSGELLGVRKKECILCRAASTARSNPRVMGG